MDSLAASISPRYSRITNSETKLYCSATDISAKRAPFISADNRLPKSFIKDLLSCENYPLTAPPVTPST